MAQSDPAVPPPPRRKRRHPFRVLFLIILLILGALCYPPVFRFVAGAALQAFAWRHHARFTADRTEGSLWEPMVFTGVRVRHRSMAGSDTVLEIARARASFSWKNLVFKKGTGWWRELALEGVRGSTEIPAEPNAGRDTAEKSGGKNGEEKSPRVVLPSALVVRDADFLVRQKNDSVRFRGVAFRASNLESNEISIRAIEIREPWLDTRFADLRGTIALQDSRVTVANLPFEHALVLQSASANLVELARGRLLVDFALAAFGGTIRGDLKSSNRDENLNFESAGRFAQISVARLAAFLGEDADGTIREGKFTFHGSPRNLQKATISTRLEATDFRWGRRQWNSLVLGATAVNRRVMIPELQLRQAHNTLALNGDADIPPNWRDWWQGNFQCNVAAKIDSLSELSALFGTDPASIAGKLQVDGAVRGQSKNFSGQLIIAGSHLSYRAAPLDELHAAVKLSGNEIQVPNAEIIHGADFVRGRGVVNILGEKRYWGELKASMADLALYSAIMQPPVAPRAFAGGLTLDWSGDGAARAHSGAFSARLKKVRPLGGADAAEWHPLDLDAEATYSPDNLYFSRFLLADSDTWLSAKVVASPAAVTLQELRIDHRGAPWLAGEARLPLNLWAAWEDPAAPLRWSYTEPCKANLTAQNLSLADALRLSGRELPIRGEVRGNLVADGTLADLTLGGQMLLKKVSASTPLGELSATDADLGFDAQTLTVNSARGVFEKLAWDADGAVALKDVREPMLALNVRAPKIPLALSGELRVETALAVKVEGSPRAPKISGDAKLLSANLDRKLSVPSLLENGGAGLDAALSPLRIAPHPEWQLDVSLKGSGVLRMANTTGIVAPELRVTGSADAPLFSGKVDGAGFTVADWRDGFNTTLSVDEASIFLVENAPRFLVAHLTGNQTRSGDDSDEPDGIGFDGYVYGPLADKSFTWQSSERDDDPGITALLLHNDASAAPPAPLYQPLADAALDFGRPAASAGGPLLKEGSAAAPEAAVWNPVHVPPAPEPEVLGPPLPEAAAP